MDFAELTNKNNKICIIMLGLFGDVLLRTPLITSIRYKYPSSSITVIVDQIGYDILYNNPNVDNIIIINRNRNFLIKYFLSKILVQFKIIFSKFDLIVDLYGGSSSRRMLNLSFCKNKLISKVKKTSYYNFKNKFHITNQLFESLHILNLEKNKFDILPKFYINQNIENTMLNYNDFPVKKNNYLISLGSGDLQKILHLQKFFEVISYLYYDYKIIPAIVLNPGQEFLQNDLINDYLLPNKIPYVKLDKMSVDEIGIIIQNSSFFIVPDTGLMHLSLALKTPTFCIFTKTNPFLVEPESNDIIFQACYKLDNSSSIDNFGLRFCKDDLDIEYIKHNLSIFLKKININ